MREYGPGLARRVSLKSSPVDFYITNAQRITHAARISGSGAIVSAGTSGTALRPRPIAHHLRHITHQYFARDYERRPYLSRTSSCICVFMYFVRNDLRWKRNSCLPWSKDSMECCFYSVFNARMNQTETLLSPLLQNINCSVVNENMILCYVKFSTNWFLRTISVNYIDKSKRWYW